VRLLLASTNAHKVAEFRRLFDGSRISICTPHEIGVPPVDAPEIGATFLENATIKAHAYLQAYRMATIADDSGICVDALAGAPGVRSARFGRPDFDDADRARYLLECLSGTPPALRGAHYVCELVLAFPDAASITARGALYGTVAEQWASGTTGFGYDPIFKIPAFDKTVSQLSVQQKDSISHRGKAVRHLIDAISATD
jgi:XTP/dITP diphosphohydrolase